MVQMKAFISQLRGFYISYRERPSEHATSLNRCGVEILWLFMERGGQIEHMRKSPMNNHGLEDARLIPQ